MSARPAISASTCAGGIYLYRGTCKMDAHAAAGGSGERLWRDNSKLQSKKLTFHVRRTGTRAAALHVVAIIPKMAAAYTKRVVVGGCHEWNNVHVSR